MKKLTSLLVGPSWVTTIIGAVAGLPVVLNEVQAQLDSDPDTVLSPERLLAGVGIILGLRVARDGNKSSQDHHVRPQ